MMCIKQELLSNINRHLSKIDIYFYCMSLNLEYFLRECVTDLCFLTAQIHNTTPSAQKFSFFFSYDPDLCFIF